MDTQPLVFESKMQPCLMASCLASLVSSLITDAVSQNSTCLPLQRGHDIVRQATYVLPTSHTCNMLCISSDKDPDRYHHDEFLSAFSCSCT
jgi:hypothetical protein